MDQVAASPSQDRSRFRRLFYNKEVRSVFFQIVTVLGVCALIAYICLNMLTNLEAVGKELSFSFLGAPAGYDITFQPFVSYSPTETHFRAAMVGLSNTLLVAITGIILATIMGFTLGVMRLSRNFLISRLSQAFIDFTRNVPVLLHIFFIYGLVINVLPKPKQAEGFADIFFLTNRGLYAPKPIFEEGAWLVLVALIVAIGASIFIKRWAKARQIATGQVFPVFWTCAGLIIGLLIIAFFISGMPISFDFPKLKGFNFKGGFILRPEYLALWFALSYYTSCFIAEIVRGGILAIHKGQREASLALGVTPNRTLQLVIIPQAMPLIIPPLASNYLNLTKNSSLAIAIGYYDIVATLGGISLMQTGKEVETMFLVLACYLVLSLIISGSMNFLNSRLQLKSR
mgnify:FL=1